MGMKELPIDRLPAFTPRFERLSATIRLCVRCLALNAEEPPMPSAIREPPKFPASLQSGKRVKKRDGSKPLREEVPLPSPPLDAATKAVLNDKDNQSPPLIIPEDE